MQVAKPILADLYDVYLKKENPCSRTVDGHYELDAFEYRPSRQPYRPMGAVDGKVVDSDMAKVLNSWVGGATRLVLHSIPRNPLKNGSRKPFGRLP